MLGGEQQHAHATVGLGPIFSASARISRQLSVFGTDPLPKRFVQPRQIRQRWSTWRIDAGCLSRPLARRGISTAGAST
jgi:hypothetical protein